MLGLGLVLGLALSPLSPAATAPVSDGSARAGSSADLTLVARDRDCLTSASARTTRGRDTVRVTPARLRRWDRDFARRLEQARAEGASPAGARTTLRIGVHAHVVDGTHRGERGPKPKGVRRQLRIVNSAYNGGQSDFNVASPFRFHLLSYERVTEDRWHHGALNNRADRSMRRALHRGSAAELNLYFSGPELHQGSGGVVLGYSSFPWASSKRPQLDGVTVHIDSLPGGRARRYNQGDSAVHEIGHWLGLFHTFEGGCSARNDRVGDTAAEAYASFACERGRDTCAEDPGIDPIHNFLDYSFDACMNRFSAGQIQRMANAWLAYRTP